MDHTYFVPKLLTGSPQRSDRVAIRKTIRDLLAQRGMPLHVTNLWNALYYRWDFDGGCHSRLNPDRIETRALGAIDWSIPVGGFVRIETGTNEFWAEVVYKEGRNPAALDIENGADWSVPPGFVNARPSNIHVFQGQQVQVLDELLVLDFDAFGMAQLDEKRIKRLQARGKRLDRWGHLPMQAAYEVGDAELDDAAFFAAHLMAHHRTGLLAEFLTRSLTDHETRAALLTSLRTVSDIAAEIDGVRQWNGYFFLAEDFQTALNDRAGPSKFGADMFSRVARYVLRLPPLRGRYDAGRPQVEYNAIVPTLRHYAGHQGYDPEEVQALSGPGHSRLVCWLNTYVADQVRATKDGVVSFGEESFAVRRADPWLFGGVWRSERVTTKAPLHAVIPALVPLPLDHPDLPPVDRVERELAATPALPEPAVDFRPEQRRLTLTLSQRTIEQEHLQVGRAINALAPGMDEVRLQIGIEREQTVLLDRRVGIDRRRGVLTEVRYGAQFYPGMRLVGWVEPSGEVIRVYGRRLVAPIEIEDDLLEFEFDEDLYRAALRLGRRVHRAGLRHASTFSELISRVFRVRGASAPDGALVLSLREVAVALFGPDADLEIARVVAAGVARLDQLPDGRYVWRPNITRGTKVTDAEVLAAFRASEAGQRMALAVRPHLVPMHLRRYPPRDERKWLQRAEEYRKERVASGAQHRLPPELPRDCTFVRAFQRRGSQEVGDSTIGRMPEVNATPSQLPLFERDGSSDSL